MDILKQNIANVIPDGLVFLDLIRDEKNSRIKVIVDGKKSVDLGTTTAIARKIRNSEMLLEEFPDGVQLEVTSPGLGAPLLHPMQYEKNLGRSLKVSTLGSRESVVIELIEVNQSGIRGKSEDGKLVSYDFDQIESAKVKLKF